MGKRDSCRAVSGTIVMFPKGAALVYGWVAEGMGLGTFRLASRNSRMSSLGRELSKTSREHLI